MKQNLMNFCKEFPQIGFTCPSCGHRRVYKTFELFKNDMFTFECEICRHTINEPAEDILGEFYGISVLQ